MKVAPAFAAILTAALLACCCRVCPAQSGGANLPRSMKGYELYSWAARGEWHFALLRGTNRIKTRAEVRAPGSRLRGVEALKRKLDMLAEGEEVFWTTGFVQGTALPPEKVIEEVRSHCERRGIVLRVNRRDGPRVSKAGRKD